MNQEEVVEARVCPDSTAETRPVRWRELLAVVAIVALADVTVYRGHGYSGYALLFVGGAMLLLVGSPPLRTPGRSRHMTSCVVVGCLILGLAAKMMWCGWGLHVFLGVALLCGFAIPLSGTVPYVLEIVVFPARVVLGGLLGLSAYTRTVPGPERGKGRRRWLEIALPLVTFVAFSFLFVLANPDLLDAFGRHVERMLSTCRQWLIEYSPQPTEIFFWAAIGWVAVGMLRPLLNQQLLKEFEEGEGERAGADLAGSASAFYAVARNTLVTVILLFATYLVFEFRTLWFREFPPGFYYSGYAHQGAAWLTVALGLATVVLSLVFRGTVLHDPRVKILRCLAWVWSLENVLLAIAVYHRLYIYVGFNGMTRMRVVGILGISAVLVGFLLVVRKITGNRGFLWLLRRHLWTVALAVYLYGVLPVDSLVVSYNVQRILSGDPAPTVQITEHPIDSGGVLFLPPLLECKDDVVREGVRAYLAERYELAEVLHRRQLEEGWTSFQVADHLLLRKLRAIDDQLAPYREDKARRQETLKAFHTYAYQWY